MFVTFPSRMSEEKVVSQAGRIHVKGTKIILISELGSTYCP